MIRNLFKLDKNITTYKYPIIKILICIVLIILVSLDIIFDQIHYDFLDNKVFDIIYRASTTIIFLACVLRIYISLGELSLVSENRAKNKTLSDSDMVECKEYTLDDIISLSEKYDLMDIRVVSGNKTVGVGPTAVYKYGGSKFHNKHFYVADEEF